MNGMVYFVLAIVAVLLSGMVMVTGMFFDSERVERIGLVIMYLTTMIFTAIFILGIVTAVITGDITN